VLLFSILDKISIKGLKIYMDFNIKIIFTLAIIIIGALIFFADPGKGSAGPDWIWRFGKNDSFRNLFFCKNGSMRRFSKLFIMIIFSVVLLMLWILVPTNV